MPLCGLQSDRPFIVLRPGIEAYGICHIREVEPPPSCNGSTRRATQKEGVGVSARLVSDLLKTAPDARALGCALDSVLVSNFTYASINVELESVNNLLGGFRTNALRGWFLCPLQDRLFRGPAEIPG